MSDVEEWGKRVAGPDTRFTQLERKLLEYINSNPHEAAFMSLRELCEETGVSKPKVINFYRKLDYQNFRLFRESIQRFYAHHINAYRSSRATFRQVTTVADLIAAAREADVHALERLAEHITTDDLSSIASAVMDARVVYIHGSSTGRYPAHYLYQRLKRYRMQVHLIGQDVQHMLEDVYAISQQDLLLVFHYFPDPETTRSTMKLAKDAGACVMVVSDTVLVDLAEAADRLFFVERGSMGFKNSMAVPMHFVNLLLLTLELIGGERYQNSLKQVESMRDTYGFR